MESRPPSVAFLPQIVLYIGIINVLVILYLPDSFWSFFIAPAFLVLCFGGVTWYSGSKKCKQ